MIKDRYITPDVVDDLQKKMVFIGGPRQVGKTTLARKLIGGRFRETAYFNWDSRRDRRAIMASAWPASAELIILDELHKLKGWKRFIKGEYDTRAEHRRFLVTGSARMDIYRKGGDSLQGRYHHYRLHPFTVAELANVKNVIKPLEELPIGPSGADEEMRIVERYGGFPEPLFAQNDRTLRRWINERQDRLFREDIRDVEIVRDISHMRVLVDMLPARVGSLLSINALRGDLEVSHRAVSHWLNILEEFYYHFRIYPFVKASFRSLKKEPKLYLWDWSEVQGEPSRFENIVALHLLKLTHWLRDREGYDTALSFLRDTEKREVDFLVTSERKPWFAVETKIGDESVSPALRYFREKVHIPFVYQVVRKPSVDKIVDGVRIVSADKFLRGLL